MEIAGPLASLVSTLTSWLPRVKERANQRADAEVAAVLKAITETQAHLADYTQGRKRDRKQEKVLMRLWREAAVAIRRTDRNLAQRLSAKADYWMNPENWTPDDVKAAQIRISDIAEEGRMLLLKR